MIDENWGPLSDFDSRKLYKAGGQYNSNLNWYEMPDGSSIKVDQDLLYQTVRYSVFPKGISYWTVDQSSVRRYGILRDALASIGE